jgi:hypothetical protein
LTFVSVDEFSFNLAMQRNYGRLRHGRPAIQVTPANRGGNVNVEAAIQKGPGAVCRGVSETPFNGRSFSEFMNELIGYGRSNPVLNLCIFLDNCRIHEDLSLGEQLGVIGGILKVLPPSSLMLNPIAEVFADLKRPIRLFLSTTIRAEVLGIHNLPWGEKAGGSRWLLARTLDIAFQRIILEQVDSHYAHAFSSTTSALRRVAS